MPQRLDLATWKRRRHFELFRHSSHPFFSVTVDVDVTRVWQRRAADGGSFFLPAVFALLRAIDDSEPLRLRIRADEVWRHEHVGLGTTILRADETFAFARLDLAPSYQEFRAVAAPAIAEAKASLTLDPMDDVDDLIYHSTMPWLRFTAYTNAMSGTDSIPRIMFGKVFADGAAWRMPVGIEVHHALVDGLDVARFVGQFEQQLSSSLEDW